MANIFTVLNKEIEKGNLYFDEKGNTINHEKIETLAKKSYVIDLKNGTIGFEKSYPEYLAEIMEKYVPVSAVEAVICSTIGYVEEVPEMPEPTAEPATVAN